MDVSNGCLHHNTVFFFQDLEAQTRSVLAMQFRQVAPLPPVVALNRNFKSQIAARYAAFWHAIPEIAVASFPTILALIITELIAKVSKSVAGDLDHLQNWLPEILRITVPKNQNKIT